VLLAGGSGTRLWPVSRGTMPKQFLPLIGHHSTCQQAVHRLVNPGKIPLELIEAQTGSHLGEDDIIRLDDVYGRG